MKGFFTKVWRELKTKKGIVKHPGTHNSKKTLPVLNLKRELLEE